MEEFLLKLYSIGTIKFGEFKLKSGIMSPIYFDFRSIVSYPNLLKLVAAEIWKVAGKLYEEGKFTHICGVPYTALPIATAISVLYDVPMILKRKEAKSYGTANMLEGVYEQGTKVLIIEDVVTTGTSIMETALSLNKHGLIVTDAVVLLDRMQGAKEALDKNHINMHPLICVDSFLNFALDKKLISKQCFDSCTEFLKGHKIVQLSESSPSVGPTVERNHFIKFSDMLNITDCTFNKKLINIILSKETNLAIAADLTTCGEVLALAEKVGPYICLLKTHLDIVHDFSEEFLIDLKKTADRYNFLLFEDRKFADIGNTVSKQLNCSHFKISRYFDLINAHIFPGSGVIEGLKMNQENSDISLSLLAEMSSEGNFFDQKIKDACLQYANTYSSFISGFICQNRIDYSGKFLHITPGVSFDLNNEALPKGDSLKQTYRSIPQVIEAGADIMILGRAITNSSDPASVAASAKYLGFTALKARGSI